MRRFVYTTSTNEFKEVRDSDECLPEDDYELILQKAKIRIAKTRPLTILSFTFEVVNEHGYLLFDHIVITKSDKLQELCEAMNVTEMLVYDDEDNPVPSLIGKHVRAYVKISNHPEFGARNEIVSYKPLNEEKKCQ
jgi:hypothetical protein